VVVDNALVRSVEKPTFLDGIRLVATVAQLGVPSGSILPMHTSLSTLGRVVGGEQAVSQALRDSVGRSGTLVMSAQSWQLCDQPDLLGRVQQRVAGETTHSTAQSWASETMACQPTSAEKAAGTAVTLVQAGSGPGGQVTLV
jgi:hypothetical protein